MTTLVAEARGTGLSAQWGGTGDGRMSGGRGEASPVPRSLGSAVFEVEGGTRASFSDLLVKVTPATVSSRKSLALEQPLPGMVWENGGCPVFVLISLASL